MIEQNKRNKENFQIPKDSKSEMMRRHLSWSLGYCKGDWGTRLQENPQLILQLVFMIQLTSRRILRE